MSAIIIKILECSAITVFVAKEGKRGAKWIERRREGDGERGGGRKKRKKNLAYLKIMLTLLIDDGAIVAGF